MCVGTFAATASGTRRPTAERRVHAPPERQLVEIGALFVELTVGIEGLSVIEKNR